MADKEKRTPEPGRSSLHREPGAIWELLLLLAVAGGVLLMGGWVDQPMKDAGCDTVVAFELALPAPEAPPLAPDDTSPGGVVEDPPATPTVRGLQTIEGAKADCDSGVDAIADALRSSIVRDYAFILVYVVALVWCCSRAAGQAPRRLAHVEVASATGRVNPIPRVGMWFAVAAGLCDLAENQFLSETADHLASPDYRWVVLTFAAASAKFLLLVLPVAVTLWMLVRLFLAWLPNRRRPPSAPAGVTRALDGVRSAYEKVASADQTAVAAEAPVVAKPEDLTTKTTTGPVDVWTVPHASPGKVGVLPNDADGDRYGICLSGGGIRSATFGLGALQQLDGPDVPPGYSLRKARYLSAVSGGSYIAASYQFLARGGQTSTAPTAPSPLAAPTGKVEDHLRRFATHLADGAKEWLFALIEIVGKAFSGFAILVALIWVTALPLGWFYRAWGHGLDADLQPAPTIDLTTGLAVAAVAVVFGALAVVNRALTYGLVTSEAGTALRQAFRTAVFGAAFVFVVVPVLVPRIESGVTSVARLAGVADDPPQGPERDKVMSHLADLAVAATEAGAAAADAVDAVSPGTGQEALAASITAAEAAGQVARLAASDLEQSIADNAPDGRLTIPPVTDIEALCAPGPAEAPEPPGVVALACQAANASADAATAAAALARAAAADGPGAESAAAAKAANESAGAAADATEAIGALRKELDGHTTGGQPEPNPPLAWAGLTALVTAVGGVVGKRRMDVGKAPTPPKKKSPNPIVRRLGFGGISEVVAGAACALVLVVAFSDVLVDAWRRGPDGDLKLLDTHSAFAWWAVAVAGLLVVFSTVNVNTWSLRGFYHRRLWLAYAVTPEGETAPWQTDTRLSEMAKKREDFPELLVCAAAQTSGREWAPPGRRAVSFVFSGSRCGGPRTGYVGTADLEDQLGRYRSPITLYGAVATSGAAFGPAMGRQSKGGLGAVLAIANARLGAWLPNPLRMHQLAQIPPAERRVGSMPRRPGLLWWLREILGRYPLDASMVLTTDGGHIENLGLVELLRRRCDRILCFDASGAGATPTTLAEAVVLAREELGVDIDLYAPNGDPLLEASEFGADPLRRVLKDEPMLAERLAKFPVIVGEIHYPPGVDDKGDPIPKGTGRLVYGTLALTERTTWDVLEYAHRNPTFPNDGTDQQWFRANTFAAYHQLGRDVARAMVATAETFPDPPAGGPFPGPPTSPPEELDSRIGVIVVTADELP